MHSLTHTRKHSLTHTLTHALTHSLTHLSPAGADDDSRAYIISLLERLGHFDPGSFAQIAGEFGDDALDAGSGGLADVLGSSSPHVEDSSSSSPDPPPPRKGGCVAVSPPPSNPLSPPPLAIMLLA